MNIASTGGLQQPEVQSYMNVAVFSMFSRQKMGKDNICAETSRLEVPSAYRCHNRTGLRPKKNEQTPMKILENENSYAEENSKRKTVVRLILKIFVCYFVFTVATDSIRRLHDERLVRK